jgi:hypothetical protein
MQGDDILKAELNQAIYPTGDVINVKHSSLNYDESSDP